MAAEQELRSRACQKYVRFILHSYLKWESTKDLCDASCVVRFNKPTLVGDREFYPRDFLDLLRLQLLVTLETEYRSSASGWEPHVSCKIADDETALNLEVWFTQNTEAADRRPHLVPPPASKRLPPPPPLTPPPPCPRAWLAASPTDSESLPTHESA